MSKEEIECPECEGNSYWDCDCCGAEEAFACDLCDGSGIVEYDEEEDELE